MYAPATHPLFFSLLYLAIGYPFFILRMSYDIWFLIANDERGKRGRVCVIGSLVFLIGGLGFARFFSWDFLIDVREVCACQGLRRESRD